MTSNYSAAWPIRALRFLFVLLLAQVLAQVPATAIAFPVDFDGDGKTDPTVYRPAHGMWYMLPSTGFCPAGWTVIGPGQCQKQWGLPGDIPLVGEFDRDGKGDPTVYRPSNQHFYITYSSYSGSVAFQFPDGSGGIFPSTSDIPDIADVNDDGRSDIIVYKPRPHPLRSEGYVGGSGGRAPIRKRERLVRSPPTLVLRLPASRCGTLATDEKTRQAQPSLLRRADRHQDPADPT